MSQTKAQLVGGVGISTAQNVVVGSAVTINSTGIDVTGIVTATSFSGDGSGLSGISSVSFATTSYVLAGTPNIVVGIATATTFVGNLTGTATSTTNIPNLSGDITSSNTSTTLATVNSDVGTFGDSGAIPSITVNEKGLVTGVSTSSLSSGITITDDTSTNAARYITFTSSTSGTISGENVSSTKLNYNPSTGLVEALGFQNILYSGSYLGLRTEGGYLICKSGGVGWIAAPLSSEVTRSWYCGNDANTVAQSVTGCTGWFVPTCGQLQNPGFSCRTYWDSYCPSTYWSSSQYNSYFGWSVSFSSGSANCINKANLRDVRSFRCVTY